MPNPKRRHSQKRTSTRRAHDALTPPIISTATYVFSGVSVSESFYPHIQPGMTLLPWILWALVLFGMGFPPSRVLNELDRYFRYGDPRAISTLIFKATPSGAMILAGGVVGIPGYAVAGRVGYMSDFFSGARQ